jgi:hypothetical protein
MKRPPNTLGALVFSTWRSRAVIAMATQSVDRPFVLQDDHNMFPSGSMVGWFEFIYDFSREDENEGNRAIIFTGHTF